MLNILIYSFRLVKKNLQALGFIYLIMVILGFTVSIPFYFIWLRVADHSTELTKLVPDFDYSIFTDFKRQSGKAFRPVKLLSLVLGLLFLLINVFFTGGLVSAFLTGESRYTFNSFLRTSARLFPGFLVLVAVEILYFLAAAIVFGLLLYVFMGFAEGGIETDYALAGILPFLFLFLSFSFIMVCGDYSKNIICNNPHLSSFDAFNKTIVYVFRHLKSVVIFWAILLHLAIVVLVYFLADLQIGMTSVTTIYVMLLIQQLLIFLRIFIKAWRLAAASEYLRSAPFLTDSLVTAETGNE